jgi:hypothetical protein
MSGLDRMISEATFGWERAARWLGAQEHPEAAWEACSHAAWMLWYIGAVAGPVGSADRSRLVAAACDCAELALSVVPAGEDRPRKAIEAARAWTRGELSLGAMKSAALAAYQTEGAGSIPAAASAAYAAAFAAYAHNPHHDCGGAADSAAQAVASQAAVGYTRANRLRPVEGISFFHERKNEVIRECADIVRRHYPGPPTFREFW